MRIKILTNIIFIVGCFSASTTYAAASLWGNIDVPEHNEVTLTPIAPATPVEAAPLKSVCDVLAEKADLGNDIINSSKMQSDLKIRANTVKPEYVMLLTDPTATKKLYQQFREIYLKQNCKK